MKSYNLNLRHLAALIQINRLGSISKAAPIVHLSQSAITQGIANLEKNLRSRLFERTSSGLQSSCAGKIFLYRVERAFCQLEYLNNLASTTNKSGARKLTSLLTSTQLRSLVTVVEKKNYTLAAKQLGLTQPTLHRAIKDLELNCGKKLLHRSPTGVEPNWTARQIALRANLYFSELFQGIDELNELAGRINGRLNIGSLPLARTSIVPNTVVELLTAFPDANVHIIDGPYEELLCGLLHGNLDVIIGALRKPSPSPDIIQQYLFDDPLHIVVRPEHILASRKAYSVNELRELKWVAPRKNTPAREVFTNFFISQGLKPPNRVIECSSLVATRSLLLASDRAALLSARQVALEIESNILAISPQKLEGTTRKIGFTVRKDWEPTKLQKTFLRYVKNTKY